MTEERFSFSIEVRESDKGPESPTLWEAEDTRDGETAMGATPSRAIRGLVKRLENRTEV